MNTVVMDWVINGMLAVTFILVGKMLTMSYNVPVLSKMFAAV